MGWECRSTIEHIGGDFIHYAGQVVLGPTDHYVPFSFNLAKARTHAELVEAIDMAGRMLAAAVSHASADSRGWYPQGQFTPSAFAAMGTCEALHGHDITSGLGNAWLPDNDLSEVLLRKFLPDAVAQLNESPAGEVLLWATGRLQISEHPDVTHWDYRRALT